MLSAAAVMLLATAVPEPGELEELSSEALSVRRIMLREDMPSLAPRVILIVGAALNLVAGTFLGVAMNSGRPSDVSPIAALQVLIPAFILGLGGSLGAFGAVSLWLGVRDRQRAHEQLDRIDAVLAQRLERDTEAQRDLVPQR